ncbi:MAG: DUF805 domain-containing protein [Candidatus Poseidoniaceae archaeon]|jgi:uncharacterized membrane protein YhaH (DUF805 family)|nr:DUF805 domain-containing protein [Candidatus Poseidoniaceae archaeon]
MQAPIAQQPVAQAQAMPQQVMGAVGGAAPMAARPGAMMNPLDSIKSCLAHSNTFDGRASRSEFWWFYLFYIICANLIEMMAIMLEQPLISLATFALVPAGLSSSARRLHDGGRSGWNLLWCLTIIGAFVVLYWYIVDGEPAVNAYGPPPTNVL